MMTIVCESHQLSDFTKKKNLKKKKPFLNSVKNFKSQMMLQLMQSERAGTDFETWINISYQIT